MKFAEEGTRLSRNAVLGCIVYFLIDGDEVVYVGKSINGLQRVFSGHCDKSYTDVIVKEIKDERVLNYAERYYIAKYRPKYNRIVLDGVSLEKVRDFCRGYALEKQNSHDWSKERWRFFSEYYNLEFAEYILEKYRVPIVFYETDRGNVKRGISNHSMAWLIQNYNG